jgi:dihydrolipoamide dehydrogenase
MFTDPPLATIGWHPSDAMVVGSSSYADQGRARVEARNAGRSGSMPARIPE